MVYADRPAVAVEQLRLVLAELHVATIRETVSFHLHTAGSVRTANWATVRTRPGPRR